MWSSGTAVTNDVPFYDPDNRVAVVDPVRPRHELAYHPVESNLRRADAVVIKQGGQCDPDAVETYAQGRAR